MSYVIKRGHGPLALFYSSKVAAEVGSLAAWTGDPQQATLFATEDAAIECGERLFPYIFPECQVVELASNAKAGPDHYATLGLEPGATRSEIKAAYRKLAMQFHPDRGRERDGERFRAIREAYNALAAK